MKSITRLSLVLIMFSLFSISYLVTSVFAQNGTEGTATAGVAPDSMVPPTNTSSTASPAGDPGLVLPTDASSTASPKGASGFVPPAEPSSSGGITGWIRGIIGKDKPKTDLAPQKRK
jgi:hypothetical protein